MFYSMAAVARKVYELGEVTVFCISCTKVHTNQTISSNSLF